MAPPPGVCPSTVRSSDGTTDPLFASALGRSGVSLGAPPYAEDGMNSETSDCDPSDDSMDPADIYTLEEFSAEQNVLASFARRIKEKMKAKCPSKRRSGPRKFINRNREQAHEQLVADYFAADPLFSNAMFRRRFRMRRHVFLRIVSALGEWSPYFTQRVDCTNRLGLSPLQKCTAAIRMLAYGTSANTLDEYLKVAESTTMECMEKFVEGVIATFGKEYLRRPTCEEVEQLLHVGESRGFPGMLGSIDCIHWQWKKCPTAWKGQYTRGDYGKPTVILEAVASHDLRIWHGFFGMAGSNNDINVLNQSPLFFEVLKGEAPNVQFSVNGNEYNTGYYLADGIYPEWAAFVKTISSPLSEKHKLYAMHQEGARKDIERALGVLQARLNIVRRPARLWSAKIIDSIMYACIILHIMIVEDEGKKVEENIDLNHAPSTSVVLPPEANVGINDNPCFDDVRRRNAAIRAHPVHTQLKKDLVSIFGIVLATNTTIILLIISHCSYGCCCFEAFDGSCKGRHIHWYLDVVICRSHLLVYLINRLLSTSCLSRLVKIMVCHDDILPHVTCDSKYFHDRFRLISKF